MTQVYPNQFYGRRKGKPLKDHQKHLLHELLPSFLIPRNQDVIDFTKLFGGKTYNAYWLEIGFGGGEHLTSIAARYPEIGFIGAEAFVNGIASLLRMIETHNLTNVRIFPDDVRLLLQRIPPHSLEKIFILFPDPWPKLRHHRRRLINEDNLTLFASLLAPGGELRVASDHVDYIKWILQKIVLVPHLVPQFDGKSPPTIRHHEFPMTRYEEKAINKGRSCYYLSFRQAYTSLT